MKKIRLKKIIILLFMFICIVGIIYSSFKIINWKSNVDENKKIKKEISKLVEEVSEDKYTVNFDELKKQNSDTIAYLKVNNTNIDYVVVKGNDNEYYLKHNFNKTWNVAGWIFADYRNKLDGTDKNIIIYGHNTKDGTMFETLKNVLTKEWYENKDNHIITLVTENEIANYQVFSTYSIVPEDYYINTSFVNDDEFKKFINEIKSRSIYNYDVDVDVNDNILTLSSCLGSGEKRVVLHAKKIID